MIIGIIPAMRALAKVKHPHENIEPCPNKTWQDCYYHDEKEKMHILHYHVVGKKSSKAIMVHY